MTFPAFLPAAFKSALRTAFIMNMLRQWSLTSATKSLHWSTLILPHSCLKFYDGFVLISAQNFRCAIQNPCDVATQSSPPSEENGFRLFQAPHVSLDAPPVPSLMSLCTFHCTVFSTCVVSAGWSSQKSTGVCDVPIAGLASSWCQALCFVPLCISLMMFGSWQMLTNRCFYNAWSYIKPRLQENVSATGKYFHDCSPRRWQVYIFKKQPSFSQITVWGNMLFIRVFWMKTCMWLYLIFSKFQA